MWIKIFSIIPAVAELALMLMAPKKSITGIAEVGLRLAGIAAPKAKLPDANIMGLAQWGERTIADGVITSAEIIELARHLDVKVKIDGLSKG